MYTYLSKFNHIVKSRCYDYLENKYTEYHLYFKRL